MITTSYSNLKSGYNIGLRTETISSIRLIDERGSQKSKSLNASEVRRDVSPNRKKLLLISTGGTIASRVDYRTGAVHPALSAADLYTSVPELDALAEIEPEVVFSIYSENMTPADWGVLSSKIIETLTLKKNRRGCDYDGNRYPGLHIGCPEFLPNRFRDSSSRSWCSEVL